MEGGEIGGAYGFNPYLPSEWYPPVRDPRIYEGSGREEYLTSLRRQRREAEDAVFSVRGALQGGTMPLDMAMMRHGRVREDGHARLAAARGEGVNGQRAVSPSSAALHSQQALHGQQTQPMHSQQQMNTQQVYGQQTLQRGAQSGQVGSMQPAQRGGVTARGVEEAAALPHDAHVTIKRPPASATEYIQNARKYMTLLEATARDGTGWETVEVKDGVKITKRLFPQADVHCYKGITKIKAPVSEVYDFLNSENKWDDVIEENVVETYPSPIGGDLQDICVYHVAYPSGTFLASNRDFCLFWAGYRMPRGGYCILQRSTVHSLVPEKSGYVRGEVKWGGYVIEPSSTDPNHSVVFAIMQMHASGWLPGSIGENMGHEHVAKLNHLRSALERRMETRRITSGYNNVQNLAHSSQAHPQTAPAGLQRSTSRFNSVPLGGVAIDHTANYAGVPPGPGPAYQSTHPLQTLPGGNDNLVSRAAPMRSTSRFNNIPMATH